MRVLIAEDDPVSRHILQATLHKWGYEVVVCTDGTEHGKCFKEMPHLTS